MKIIFSSLLFLISFNIGIAQVGAGLTVTTSLYDYYQNPSDNTGKSTSAGSFLLNPGIGPKVWFGGDVMSFSVEAQAILGIFGLSSKDYKGLGVASFPIMAKLNFGGLSGLDKEGKFGFTIGGGIQYSKTEIYYISDEFTDIGGMRDYFKVYLGQIGYGFGMSGFNAHAFVRYGWSPDTDANIFNIGLQYDFNIPKLRQITDPESEL